MEKRIDLEKRGRPANQITELNLDNCRSTNIVGLTDEYTALETLSLINVGLTSLKGFPKLPNLKKLELSDNRIANGLNNLSGSPKLTNLNLSGNKIKDLDELKALAEFKNLAVLDLFNNEVSTTTENYREKIFSLIPSLVYLDGYDAQDVECVSDGDDEDELNGNDSEDAEGEGEDISKPFFVNGMEFDLGELEQFEKRLADKRQHTATTNTTSSTNSNQKPVDEVDELDVYLDRLAIDIKNRQVHQTNQTKADDCDKQINDTKSVSSVQFDDNNGDDDDCARQTIATVVPSTQPIDTSLPAPTSLPLLLFGFFSILFFISTVACNRSDVDGDADGDGDDDGDGDEDGLEFDEDDDDDEEENGVGVSLSAVYDDNLDEENSDEYVEEVEDEESDAEDEEDDDEAEKSTEQPAAEDASPRGTKRKHDEDDNDG